MNIRDRKEEGEKGKGLLGKERWRTGEVEEVNRYDAGCEEG